MAENSKSMKTLAGEENRLLVSPKKWQLPAQVTSLADVKNLQTEIVIDDLSEIGMRN